LHSIDLAKQKRKSFFNQTFEIENISKMNSARPLKAAGKSAIKLLLLTLVMLAVVSGIINQKYFKNKKSFYQSNDENSNIFFIIHY